MSFIGIVFFYVFGGNILLSWGLVPWKKATFSRFAAPLLLIASALMALVDGVVFRLVLSPWGLESMGPFVFTLSLIGALALLRVIVGRIRGRRLAPTEDIVLSYSLVLYAAAMAAAGCFSSTWMLLAGGASAALGYLAATYFLEAILSRLELEPIPSPFKGTPIRLISAGLMALAFSGIDAAFFSRLTLR